MPEKVPNLPLFFHRNEGPSETSGGTHETLTPSHQIVANPAVLEYFSENSLSTLLALKFADGSHKRLEPIEPIFEGSEIQKLHMTGEDVTPDKQAVNGKDSKLKNKLSGDGLNKEASGFKAKSYSSYLGEQRRDR
jgi:hypothetical protein